MTNKKTVDSIQEKPFTVCRLLFLSLSLSLKSRSFVFPLLNHIDRVNAISQKHGRCTLVPTLSMGTRRKSFQFIHTCYAEPCPELVPASNSRSHAERRNEIKDMRRNEIKLINKGSNLDVLLVKVDNPTIYTKDRGGGSLMI